VFRNANAESAAWAVDRGTHYLAVETDMGEDGANPHGHRCGSAASDRHRRRPDATRQPDS